MTSYEHESPAAALSDAEREQPRERARLLNRTRIARRSFLQYGGAVSLSALLAACGSNTASTPTTGPTPNIAAPAPTAPPNTGTQATTAPAPTTGAASAVATRPAASAVTGTTSAGSAVAGTPAAAAQTIGKLQVITDPRPKYSGTPTDSPDTLNIIRAEDISSLSPITLDAYSPFAFVYD